MLDLAQPYIHEGDIVIFSPEQNVQTLSMHFNSELMWQAVDGVYRMLSDLSKKHLSAMAGQFAHFAAKKYNYYKTDHPPAPEGVYSRKFFNSYGDVILEGRNQLPNECECDYLEIGR